jgi:hypothetical protein
MSHFMIVEYVIAGLIVADTLTRAIVWMIEDYGQVRNAMQRLRPGVPEPLQPTG